MLPQKKILAWLLGNVDGSDVVVVTRRTALHCVALPAGTKRGEGRKGHLLEGDLRYARRPCHPKMCTVDWPTWASPCLPRRPYFAAVVVGGLAALGADTSKEERRTDARLSAPASDDGKDEDVWLVPRGQVRVGIAFSVCTVCCKRIVVSAYACTAVGPCVPLSLLLLLCAHTLSRFTPLARYALHS